MAGNKLRLFFFGSVLGLLVCMLLGLCFGVTATAPTTALRALLQGGQGDSLSRVLFYVRLPRVLGAMLAGSGLAVSGAVIQAVLSNPLASPNIIGVNSGAGLFVLLCGVFFPHSVALAPLAAFIGALLATAVVLLFSALSGQSGLGIVLAGFAVSSVFGAGMNVILVLYPDAYVGAGSFLSGGLGGVTLAALRWPAAYIVLGLPLAFSCAHSLNLLSLGRDAAYALGMRVPLWRLLNLLVAAALAGAAVSFGGLIGFVGLLAPHAARIFCGYDNRILLPASAIWGAAFVLLCDLLARSLFAPYELPVGILMALIGGPAFLLLLFRYRGALSD